MSKYSKSISNKKYIIKTIIFLFIIVFTFAYEGITNNKTDKLLEGKVVKVIDGDTIEVLNKNTPYRIRLYGVDCPERKQPFSKKAKDFTSNLVGGKVINVKIISKDRYGRLIGEVFINDVSLNEELLKEGLAWWYKKFATSNYIYQELEREAKREGKGLWIDKEAISPWEFRKKNRK